MLSNNFIITIYSLVPVAIAISDPKALAGLANIKPGLALRQYETAKCTASVVSIIDSIPTPTKPLADALSGVLATALAQTPSNVCNLTASIPTSLSSALSSYDSAISSWYNKESSDIAELITSCSGASAVKTISAAVSAWSAYTGVCQSGATNSTTTSSTASPLTTATATNGSSSGINTQVLTGTSSTTSSSTASASTAGAPRPTGVEAGVMAAAGIIGVFAGYGIFI